MTTPPDIIIINDEKRMEQNQTVTIIVLKGNKDSIHSKKLRESAHIVNDRRLLRPVIPVKLESDYAAMVHSMCAD